MPLSISFHCPQCGQYAAWHPTLHGPEAYPLEIHCPQCQHQWGTLESIAQLFERCPCCACRQFYLSKDFNQLLGCAVMLVGIALVPWTYGLSLPVFALLDWVLHRRVPTLVNCYRCGAEFREVAFPTHFKPFMHHIGLKYDRKR